MNSPPILRSWVQKSTLHLINCGQTEVLKRPFLPQKDVTRVRPPSEPEIHPPLHPGNSDGTCDFLPDITSETPCMGSYCRVIDGVQNSRAVLPTKGRSILVICLCPYGVELTPGHSYDKPIYVAVDPKVGSQQFKPLQMGEIDKCRRSLVAPSLVTTV